MKLYHSKRAVFAVIIILLCALFSVLCFSCDNDNVCLNIVLSEDEIVAGAEIDISADISGTSSEIKKYKGLQANFDICEGESFAKINKDGKLEILDNAPVGATVSVRLTIGNKKVEKQVTILPSPVSSITISLSSYEVYAGDEIALSSEILPEQARANAVTYTLIEGANVAQIVGDTLKISDNADVSDLIKISATAAGVTSEISEVTVLTVQARIVNLTAEKYNFLWGESLLLGAQVTPSNAMQPTVLSIVSGAEYATLQGGTLTAKEGAPLGASIIVEAKVGSIIDRKTFKISYEKATKITPKQDSQSILRGDTLTLTCDITPTNVNLDDLTISVQEGASLIDFDGTDTFTVKNDATIGGEIVFLFELDDVYATLSFIVNEKFVTSLYIYTSDRTSWLKCGEKVSFNVTANPSNYDGEISYIAKSGGDLVDISGGNVSVKAGAGRGEVKIVARAEDGTESNEINFTVSGRYTRMECATWTDISLTSLNASAVWLVLPTFSLNARNSTILVPKEITDLIIQGAYNGNANTAYENLYFYFRHTEVARKITLDHFATIATAGFGGSVFDIGTEGETEIALVGQNLVQADSPYFVNNTGEEMDGVWNSNFDYKNQEIVRRNGKDGYNGTQGGIAISGYNITFTGTGTLKAVAGNGTNGSIGGDGANAEFMDDVFVYVAGKGGDGGNGGDSGVAIKAYSIDFKSGLVTAVAGNAGLGGQGGKGGNVNALAGQDVQAYAGENGKNGKNGRILSGISATIIHGTNYVNDIGTVVSRTDRNANSFSVLLENLSDYYGFAIKYGTALYNPYKNASYSKRYLMTEQTKETELKRQSNMLAYTLSMMPKNIFREIVYVSNNPMTVYLCNTINTASGSVIYGLTNNKNNVWFATFNTKLRGVIYSNYFNIMLHEFIHVLHYNMGTSSANSMKSAVSAFNGGLSYGKTTDSKGVYGITDLYNATNSCFLTAYSRKTELEDVAETVSLIATLVCSRDFIESSTNIRKKFDVICNAFFAEYQTLSAFVNPYLFANWR